MTDFPPDAESVPDSEEWFLEQADQPDPDLPRLRASIEGLAARAATAQAEERAKLLQDLLVERGRLADAVEILRLRSAWMGSAAAGAVRDELFAMIGPDTEKRTMVDHVGLDEVPTMEAVRRFLTLTTLREGSPCYDKTWGFGVVRRVDGFDRKVEIDFETKPGHRMTYAYAAETLRPLDDAHLLTRLHREPDAVRAQAKDQPGEIVRSALKSFGPMTATQLQEQLSPRLVPEAEWKAFWDGARKALKKNGTVEIPSKRTDPLRIRDAEEAGSGAWAVSLLADRSMPSILNRIEAALRDGSPDLTAPPTRAALLDRLAFVLRGAGARHPGLAVRVALAADRLGMDQTPEIAVPALVARWRPPDAFVAALHDLPARETRPFLDMLRRRMGAAFDELALDSIPMLRASPLAEVLDLLLGGGREAECAARIRELVAARKADIEVLLWLHRNPARWSEWDLGRPFDFACLAVAAMEKDHAGERLKAQNALRERFAKPDSLRDLFAACETDLRLALFQRLKESTAWPTLERQAILGRIVKLYPDLEDVLRSEPRAAAARMPVTSARSYRERQAQLRRLIEEDIPKNSRDIGVARSYGDLRENFEYKAAKEMQGILLRRRAEMEEALRSVQPTVFDGPTPDRAGPGTGVEFEGGNGRREILYILGAWDRDEGLGIVSSEARIALAMTGRSAGDTVSPPGDDGVETAARITAILPLPSAVRAWARGDA